MASAEFLTSKDPQSVGAPDSNKSIDIWEANVVFPAPLGPAMPTTIKPPLLSCFNNCIARMVK